MTSKKALVAGQVKTIHINWPATEKSARREGETVFLPLEGARIVVEDYDAVSPPQGGTLENGKFTFIAPRDNYRFKVRIIGEHADLDFKVVMVGEKSNYKRDLVITFEDSIFTSDDYTLNLCDNTDLVEEQCNMIFVDEAKAWSAFQATVEMLQIARQRIGINKFIGLKVAYVVDAESKGARYQSEDDTLFVSKNSVFDWDCIGHEIGLAIAYEQQITQGYTDGYHAIDESPYDALNNFITFRNKEMAVKLAFEKGYANWFSVYLYRFLKAPYKATMLNYHGVSDTVYSNGERISIDLSSNADIAMTGEDSESSVARLFWQLTDDSGGNPIIPARQLYNAVLKQREHRNVSQFYRRVYQYLSGKDLGDLESVAGANVTKLLKITDKLGKMITEQRFIPEFKAEDNSNLCGMMNNDRVTLKWTQRNTGSAMPGCNAFKVLFFLKENEDYTFFYSVKTQRTGPNQGLVGESNYYYIINVNEHKEMQRLMLPLFYKNKDPMQTRDVELYMMLVGEANENNGASGAIGTGPYYGPLEKITIAPPARPKQTILAIDYSGSNSWTDSGNERVEKANQLLESIARRNDDIFAGRNNLFGELPTAVKLIAPYTNYDYLNPRTLLEQNSIANEVISEGYIHFAGYYYLVEECLKQKLNRPVPNRLSIYLLSDMENWTGVMLDDLMNHPEREDDSYQEILPVLQFFYGDLGSLTRAMALARENDIVFHLLSYGSTPVPVPTLNPWPPNVWEQEPPYEQTYDYHGDFNKVLMPYSLGPEEDPDAALEAVINAALDTGGTYAEVDFNVRHGNWGAMLEGLPQADDWQGASALGLVADVKFYARIAAGGAAADYLYTAAVSGPVTVTVDTQGHFAPALAVNGGGTTVNETGSEYSLSFSAVRGETYRIALNAPAGSAGLYSIVLRQAEGPAPAVTATPAQGYLQRTSAALVDGEVVVWGNRDKGLHGNGAVSVAANAAPTTVSGLSGVTALSGCESSLAALKDDGTLYRWGFFPAGMGESARERSVAEKVLDGVAQVSSGRLFTAALTRNGEVYVWGNNADGQLGSSRPQSGEDEDEEAPGTPWELPGWGEGGVPGGEEEESSSPGNVGESTIDTPDESRPNSEQPYRVTWGDEAAVRLIGSGARSVFAVTADNRVYQWGYIGHSADDGGERVTVSPQYVASLSAYAAQIVALGGGEGRGVALLADGRVISWDLQAGMGVSHAGNRDRQTPWQVMSGVSQIAIAEEGVAALTASGEVYGWRHDESDASPGLYGAKAEKCATAAGETVVALGGGAGHLLYLTASGRLYGVGDNRGRQLDRSQASDTIGWPGVAIDLS